MTRYRIQEEESAISIEVAEVGGRQEQLLEAFGECQAAQCSCPTNEYQKLASMQVEQTSDAIRIRLETKPGEKLDNSEISACLDYTTANLPEPSQGRVVLAANGAPVRVKVGRVGRESQIRGGLRIPGRRRLPK